MLGGDCQWVRGYFGGLPVALESQDLHQCRSPFVQLAQGAFDAALHDIAGAPGVQVIGDLVDVRADLADLEEHFSQGGDIDFRGRWAVAERGGTHQFADGDARVGRFLADKRLFLGTRSHRQPTVPGAPFAAACFAHGSIQSAQGWPWGRGAEAPLRSMGAQPSCRSMAAYAWSMGVRGESEVSHGLEVHGGHEGPPGPGDATGGEATPLPSGVKPKAERGRGFTRTHLASGIATTNSLLFRFGFSMRGPQNKPRMNCRNHIIITPAFRFKGIVAPDPLTKHESAI